MVYQITSTTYGKLLKIVEGVNEFVLSDHNRSPVSMSPERIEITRRTANGSRRRYFVADKRRFSVSWDDLPHDSTQTVDGGIGAEELVDLYYNSNNVGSVELHVAKRDLTTEIVDVHITNFSIALSKRFTGAHYYEVSIEFEEI